MSLLTLNLLPRSPLHTSLILQRAEENERERELRKIREDGERLMRKFGFGSG
jgi:hypothetical protein